MRPFFHSASDKPKFEQDCLDIDSRCSDSVNIGLGDSTKTHKFT